LCFSWEPYLKNENWIRIPTIKLTLNNLSDVCQHEYLQHLLQHLGYVQFDPYYGLMFLWAEVPLALQKLSLLTQHAVAKGHFINTIKSYF
jgi:hypothetical protein